MLIRSQDRKALYNLDSIENLQINKETKDFRVAVYFTENDMTTAGAYSTEAKAIKVLDMIQQTYENSLYCDHAFDNAAQVQRPYIFVQNVVFQMPQD